MLAGLLAFQRRAGSQVPSPSSCFCALHCIVQDKTTSQSLSMEHVLKTDMNARA